MAPHKASLQVAHSKGCPNEGRTSIEVFDKRSPRYSPCSTGCSPSFFTFHRDHRGKVQKGPRVKDRRMADKMLRDLQVEIDKGRAGYDDEKNIDFPDWAATYRQTLEKQVARGNLKPGTLRAYSETIDLYAMPAIGYVPVRRLAVSHFQTFYDALADLSPASQRRHLRHLRACLGAAVEHEYATSATTDRLRTFVKNLRVKAPRRGKAAFEDGELERLWSAYRQKMQQAAKPWAPVYLHAAMFSVETGLRIGELAALDLASLRGDTLDVKKTFGRDGLVDPKDGEPRKVYLTGHATAVLAQWLPIRGDHDGPLFPAPSNPQQRLSIRETQRKLVKAMEAAGIPHMHPELELPRSFHSLRYCTSGVMQRRGHDPRFIEQTLGHSTLELTLNTYGKWTPDQMRQEATRVAG